MFLRAFPAFFTFLNILQTKVGKNTTGGKCEIKC
jgi:hypothetical protein